MANEMPALSIRPYWLVHALAKAEPPAGHCANTAAAAAAASGVYYSKTLLDESLKVAREAYRHHALRASEAGAYTLPLFSSTQTLSVAYVG
jgi:hypothetical protein